MLSPTPEIGVPNSLLVQSPIGHRRLDATTLSLAPIIDRSLPTHRFSIRVAEWPPRPLQSQRSPHIFYSLILPYHSPPSSSLSLSYTLQVHLPLYHHSIEEIMPSSQPAAGHLAVQPQYLSKQPSSAAKTSEPNRSKSYDPRKPHITETPLTRKNWYKHVNWLNVTLIVGVPLLGCLSAFWTPLRWQTAVFAVVYYFMTGLGVTAGYHRLWAHTSYSATVPLRIFLALAGGGAVEGSVRWW